MLTLSNVILGSIVLAHILIRIFFRPRQVTPAVYFAIVAVSKVMFVAAAIMIFTVPEHGRWIAIALLLSSFFYLAFLKPMRLRADSPP